MSRLKEHLRSPEISIDEHVRQSQLALGAELALRKSIYLDLKYWILLRGAASGRGTAETDALLQALRQGVAEGRLFCPISESVFIELMKQSDPVSRMATARLIDELSLGVTLMDLERRVATELAVLFYREAGVTELYPLERLVWMKLSYVLGVMHPSRTAFDEATELAIQKAFFDRMWTISLTDMIALGGDALYEPYDMSAGVTAMNEGIAAHAGSIKTFAQAYSAEVRGVVDLIGADVLPGIVAAIARAKGEDIGHPSVAQRAETTRLFTNLVILALEKGTARAALPSLHTYASLHASVRWNKGKKLTANDLYDFQHAVAALGYADAFFTEKALHTMVTQAHLALDQLYACKVASDVSDALSFVRSLI